MCEIFLEPMSETEATKTITFVENVREHKVGGVRFLWSKGLSYKDLLSVICFSLCN